MNSNTSANREANSEAKLHRRIRPPVRIVDK